MTDHERSIDEALALAEKGRGWVSPNPVVGAVVVKNGHVVGRGFHPKYGDRHAEIFALQSAGENARGAILYCTLEPCNHFGKTPPCSQAIIAAGIKTVVLGALDPNPVASGGIATLRAAGIEVITGVRESQCIQINAPFFKRIQTGLPFIRLKWAMSADGRIATSTGESQWITSDDARAHAHRLRAQHDAVLIGIGTLLADGARLNCRTNSSDNPWQPWRVILDTHLRTPLDAPLWNLPSTEAGGVILASKASAHSAHSARSEHKAALEKLGATFITAEALPSSDGLEPVLRELANRGIQSVLVEGGSRVLGSFFDAKLCDAVSIYIGAKILGGETALGPLGGRGIQVIADAMSLSDLKLETVGNDVVLHACCKKTNP